MGLFAPHKSRGCFEDLPKIWFKTETQVMMTFKKKLFKSLFDVCVERGVKGFFRGVPQNMAQNGHSF